MKTIGVVGAGQLGSLRSLRSVNQPLHIRVLDPSNDCLRMAKEFT